MIWAKAMSSHGLLALIGIAGGKMEPDIPWWVVFAGVMALSFVIGILTTHSPKGDELATKGDIDDLSKRFEQLTTLDEAFEKMKPEPFGDSGARIAKVPDGTNLVKEPGKPIMVRTPIRISGIGISTFGSSVSALTLIKAAKETDDD